MSLGLMSNAYDDAAVAAAVVAAGAASANASGVVVVVAASASAFAFDVVSVGYIHHPMNYSRLDFA